MQYNINYTPHPVHCIRITDLFSNWTFVPFDPLHPLCLAPIPTPTAGNHQSVLCRQSSFFAVICGLF